MPRAASAVVLTLVGLFALATFKTSPSSAKSAALTPKRSVAATAPPNTGTNSSTSGSTPTSGSAGPNTTAGASPRTRTVDGDPIDNQYGTVQVRVTVRGSRITDVQALQMPFDHPRSQFISQQVAPMLRQEVLQAQSAQIDLVSGATFTSDSYAQSLQSALTRAGI